MLVERAKYEFLDSYSRSFNKVFSQEPWKMEEDLADIRDYMKKYFKMNNFLGFHLLDKGRLVGVCFGYLKPWIPGYEYYIDQFYIDSDYQNKKYGSKFIEEIKVLLPEDVTALALSTENDIPAYSFYISRDFKLDSKQRILYKDL